MYSIVADHFQYLASIGIIALAASGITLFIGRLHGGTDRTRRMLLRGVASLCLISLILNSVFQSRIYQNSDVLWGDTLVKNPDCWLAHNNLGMSFWYAGRDDLAKERFTDAVRVAPDYYKSRVNLGCVLADYRRYDAAIEQFEAAIQIDAEEPNAYLGLGESLVAQGKDNLVSKALEPLMSRAERLIAADPSNSGAMCIEGRALQLLNRDSEAIEILRKPLAAAHDAPQIQHRLAVSLLKTGQTAEGVNALIRSINISQDQEDRRFLVESLNLLSRIASAGQETRQGAQELSGRIESKLKDENGNLPDVGGGRRRIASELAGRACAIATEYSVRYPVFLDSLAMARADEGQFEQAAELAAQAQSRARELHMDSLADQIQSRQTLYVNHKPFVAPIRELLRD